MLLLDEEKLELVHKTMADYDPLFGFFKADKKPYGDVEYADPGYQDDKKKRYPINTETHIRAAWSYINQEKNQSQYTASQVASIKRKIIAAWKDKIDSDGPPSAAKSDYGGPDPVMGAMSDAGQEMTMGTNCTIMQMEFDVRDGNIQPTGLRVQNWDIDPNGEELEGSPDEEREQNHFAAVMQAIQHWLCAGEAEEVTPANE